MLPPPVSSGRLDSTCLAHRCVPWAAAPVGTERRSQDNSWVDRWVPPNSRAWPWGPSGCAPPLGGCHRPRWHCLVCPCLPSTLGKDAVFPCAWRWSQSSPRLCQGRAESHLNRPLLRFLIFPLHLPPRPVRRWVAPHFADEKTGSERGSPCPRPPLLLRDEPGIPLR